MSLNLIPYPSDLGDWSRQKDGTFKDRMSMASEELKSLQTSIKKFVHPKYDRSKSARGQSEEFFESIKTEALKTHKTLLDKYEDAWPFRVLTIAYVENRVAYEKRTQRLELQRQQSRVIAQAMAQDRDIPAVQDQAPESSQDPVSAALQDPSPALAEGEVPLVNAHKLSERDMFEMMIVLQAAVIRPSKCCYTIPAAGLFTTWPADEIAILDATTELDVITRLLNNCATLDPASRLYELGIAWAAKEDNVLALYSLYANRGATGTAVNTTLYSGMNALRIAAFYGAIKCVRWLLVMKADPHSVPYDGEMIPHCRCDDGRHCNHMDVMQELLRRNVSCNYKDLLHASRAGSLVNIQAIVSQGVSVGGTPYPDPDALCHSLSGGYIEIAKYLIEKGATPSSRALALALSFSLLDIVAVLVEKHPEIIRSVDSDDVDLALRSGRRDTANYLIEQGVPVDKFSLSRVSGYGWLDLAKRILSTLPTSKNRPRRVDRALREALKRGHADIAMLLLHSTGCSYKRLCLASRSGPLRIVKFILARGVPVNNDSKSQSALVHAYLGGHEDNITFLSMSGATFSPPDLKEAASSGQVDVMRSILHSGIDVNNCKLAALKEALDGDFDDIVDVLVRGISPQLLRSSQDFLLSILQSKSVYSKHMDLAQLLISNLTCELSSVNGLLAAASQSGSEKALELIISRYSQAVDAGEGGLFECRYTSCESALCVAMDSGHTHVTKFLAEHGATFAENDLAEEYTLTEGIPISIIPTVVASGMNADIHSFHRTNGPVHNALVLAACPGDTAMVEFLIRRSPDSWIRGPFNLGPDPPTTLLQQAIGRSWPGIVKALFDRGAQSYIDVDECGNERPSGFKFTLPLQMALDKYDEHKSGSEGRRTAFECVELLLKHGADVNKLERPETLKELLTLELISSLPTNTLQQIQALGYIPEEPMAMDLDNTTQVPDQPISNINYLLGLFGPFPLPVPT